MARRVEIFNNQWRIQGKGPGTRPPPPPLFLDRTDAQRAEKIGGGGDPPYRWPPLPPPSYLKVWIRL